MRLRAAGFLALILLVVLRLLLWPGYNEARDVDEVAYVQSGLQALEGMQPSMRHTPAGPQTWLTLGIGALETAKEIPKTKEFSGPLRISAAMQKVLFREYRDLNGLRTVHLLFSLAISAWAAWMLARTGRWPAGLLLAGWFLLSPMFLRYGAMAHPYSAGWAFAALALLLSFDTQHQRLLPAAFCFGLAVACRLEMIALAPVFVSNALRQRDRLFQAGAVALGTFAVAAPWFLAGLVGGLRNLVAVGALRSGNAPGHGVGSFPMVLDQGWIGWVVLAVAGLLLSARAYPIAAFLRLLPLVALAIQQAREPRYAVVWIVGLLPLVLEACRRFRTTTHGAILAAVVLLPLLQPAFQEIKATRTARVQDDSISWIESHVPAGKPIYLIPTLRAPLPRNDDLWVAVSKPDAWETKFAESAARYGFDSSNIPVALTEEPLVMERGNRRRWAILASGSEQPRYDIRPNDSVAFGEREPAEIFLKKGGCMVVSGMPLDGRFGEPAYQVRSSGSTGVFVYVR